MARVAGNSVDRRSFMAYFSSLGLGSTVAEPALIAIAKEASIVAAQAGAIGDTAAERARYALGRSLGRRRLR